MIVRTVTPPPGSSISVATDGAASVITIPHPRGSPARFLVGAFLLFWLGGWFFGFSSASSKILSGEGGGFLIFWLGAWTVGGIFAAATVYRIFRPAVAETLRLDPDGITYDSGIPPFRHDYNTMNRSDAWRSFWPKRSMVAINRQDLRSLRLREGDATNRLTIDVASARFDLARAASEVEREWLYRVLAERYALPAAAS
jgi:hypothetical protein